MAIRKIAVLGPESTGKSTLAKQLALSLKTEWVPEYARVYLENLGRPYQERDLLTIAKGQLASEFAAAQRASDYLVCDTTLLTIKIWGEYLYHRVDPYITDSWQRSDYDLYLLMDIDLPWEQDPLREYPNKREFFLDYFKRELDGAGRPYSLISGSEGERLRAAMQQIYSHFQTES